MLVVSMKAYDFQRGAANRYSREITADECRVLMGHTDGSETFYTAYQSRLSIVDVQGVASEAGQGKRNVTLFQVSG